MQELVVNSADDMYAICKGKETYIYGAKTVALRAFKYLEEKKENVHGFVVSGKYVNPYELCGKRVFRIEEERHYECMILAVGGKIHGALRKNYSNMISIRCLL